MTVDCPGCGYASPPDVKFCGECGVSLLPSSQCAQCGTSNPTGANFCHECGVTMPASPIPSVLVRPVAEGERRQLTVMFTDLADSTALSGRLDPEDYRDAVRRYHAACAEAIEQQGGYVGKWLGDGVLAYFGYPASQEDDARRAIRAGLAIVEWARNDRAGAQALSVRVGLHTGLTVISDMGSGARVEHADVVGEAPNIAARVQSVAPANAVVVSAATERVVRGFFVAESLGAQQFKGVERSVECFRILRQTAAANRLDTAERLTPIVGREREKALLLDRWQQSLSGASQVVIVSGEAGIGKSRLARTLHELLPEGHLRIELQCSQFHQNSALFPLIEHLRRLVVTPSDDGRTPTERLVAMLADAGVEDTTLPLLAALLGLPLPEGVASLDLTPEQQRRKTNEAVLAWLDADARRRAVLLVCEDLHWMDPSTLELVGMIVEREGEGTMLALLTCRPEFTPPWPPRSNLTLLQLTRLDRDEALEVVTRVAGGRHVPVEIATQIVERTDGVPLFVEELTKMVLESGLLREEGGRLFLDGPLPPLAIPETLQDSLMARLDRLAAAKEVAQLGATIAREFSQELIAAVSPHSPQVLAAALDALVASGLVYRRGFGSSARYVFKHALVQDAAYQSLLKSTRASHHKAIAEALVTRFPSVAESQPELVAHHFTEAGLSEPAVGYWQAAGSRALAVSANNEAIGQLHRCLEVIALVETAEQRDRAELAARIALGSAFLATEGYVSANAADAYARARELCYKLGATSQLVTVLWGMRSSQIIVGKLEACQELGAECLRVAEQEADPDLLIQACYVAGSTEFWRGNYRACLALMQRGAALYETERDAPNVVGQMDELVGCLFYQSLAAWFLGYPDQAADISRRMVDHARALKHHHSLSVALLFSSFVHLLRRDMVAAQSVGEEAFAISVERGIPQWGPMAQAQVGAAIAAQGDPQRGLGAIDEGLAAWTRLGARLVLTWFLGLRAEALLRSDRRSEVAAAIDEALKIGTETGERLYEAELYRLRGEAVFADDLAAAEHDLVRGIEVARELESKSLELRAATSLARLLRQRGQRDEARELLLGIYGWFGEGFDTGDLQAASTLLEQLEA